MRFIDVFIKLYLNFEIILYNLPQCFCFVCPNIDSQGSEYFWTSGVEIPDDPTRVLIDGSNGTTLPLNLCILPDNSPNQTIDPGNRLVLRIAPNKWIYRLFQKTNEQHPALCQIDPDSQFPYCPAEFLLLNGKCFHIAQCKTTYENAKQLCAAISSPSGPNSGELFSDFSSGCIIWEFLWNWMKDFEQYYCGECCHEQTTATCFLHGSYSLMPVCTKSCTCSTCKPFEKECCLDETNSTVRNGAGMSGSCVKPGELINISCEPGYHPGGAVDKVICANNGQWSSLVPNCKAMTYIWESVRYTRYTSPILETVMVEKLEDCMELCYYHPRCLTFNLKIQSGGAQCEMLDDQPKDMVRDWEFDHYKILYEVLKNDKRRIQIEL